MGFRNGLDVGFEGRSRCIAFLWKEEIDLVIKNFSKNTYMLKLVVESLVDGDSLVYMVIQMLAEGNMFGFS